MATGTHSLHQNEAATFESVTVSGALTAGSLTGTGAIALSSAVTLSGAVTMSSAVSMTGAVTMSSAVTMSGAVTLSSATTVTGSITASSAATFNGATAISSGLLLPVTAASSGTTIPVHAVHTLTASSTGQPTFNFAAPVVGQRKVLISTGASTAQSVVTVSGTFLSTAGSSQNKALFTGVGQTLTLEGISTALWAVIGNTGVALSTS